MCIRDSLNRQYLTLKLNNKIQFTALLVVVIVDVYKRQPAILSIFLGKQLSSILDEIARQISSRKMTSEEKTTLKLGIGRIPEILPVSSTHLDVYKRQIYSRTPFLGRNMEGM